MKRAAGLWVALTLLLALAPSVVAHHCDTKINVYGRLSLGAIAPPPPYASGTAGVCLRVFDDSVADSHLLPPNTDEVQVRINGDFGPSVPSVKVALSGLGFTGQEFILLRTLSPLGGYSYNMAEWVALPDGPVDGVLTATATYPGNVQVSVQYHTTLTLPPA